MSDMQTAYYEETTDQFDGSTGEITHQSTKRKIKHKTELTDEFVKVSKYLNVIFAYNNIPLNLVPISLLFAQRMQWKTNIIYLQKNDKLEIAEMLDVSLDRVNKLIRLCRDYDILRRTESMAKYEVNSFLFSTGNHFETRELQAHFDLDSDTYTASVRMHNRITGETVRKAVKSSNDKKQIPGQMTLPGLEEHANEQD